MQQKEPIRKTYIHNRIRVSTHEADWNHQKPRRVNVGGEPELHVANNGERRKGGRRAVPYMPI
jgi:hypothetical protein